MTLTEAKWRFDIDEIGLRIIINNDLRKDEDYFMDIFDRKRMLFFTTRGENKLRNLIRKFKMENRYDAN